jgi:hypothetical protein
MNPSAAAVSWNKFAATQELGLLQSTSTTTAAGEEYNKNGNVNGVGGIAGGTTLSVLRVAVRARPLQQDELTDYKTCKECVSYTSDGRAVLVGKRIFAFDRVYGPMVGQEDVYLDCVKPLVDSCCAGCVTKKEKKILHYSLTAHDGLILLLLLLLSISSRRKKNGAPNSKRCKHTWVSGWVCFSGTMQQCWHMGRQDQAKPSQWDAGRMCHCCRRRSLGFYHAQFANSTAALRSAVAKLNSS